MNCWQRQPLRLAASPLVAALLLLLAWLLPLSAGAAGGDAIVGIWEVAEGDGRIEISRCGAEYCGAIVWLKEPLYPADDTGGMAGRPLVDRDNPRKELRSRPLLGLRLMEGYRYRGDSFWDDGTIYNTENGKSYRSTIRLRSPDRLELRGYIGLPLLGGSTVWKRVGKSSPGAAARSR